MIPPKQSKLFGLSVQWSQESDSCADNNLGNSIEVLTDDGGGGVYVVIKTERWAVGDSGEIDDFCRALKEVFMVAEDHSNEK